MVITQEAFIRKIRTAIDDIAPAVADSFTEDANAELWQAAVHASTELSVELPINLLDVSVQTRGKGVIDLQRGFAYKGLPKDYLRFVSLDVSGWTGIVRELMEPGSDGEKMQRSVWSRGTATKPKAMLDQDEKGKKVIVWWPGSEEYDNAELAYIAKPVIITSLDSEGTTAEGTTAEGTTAENTEEGTTTEPEAEDNTAESIKSAIRDEAERLVIYRAASIYFEGKKEEVIAEKFRTLSTNY